MLCERKLKAYLKWRANTNVIYDFKQKQHRNASRNLIRYRNEREIPPKKLDVPLFPVRQRKKKVPNIYFVFLPFLYFFRTEFLSVYQLFSCCSLGVVPLYIPERVLVEVYASFYKRVAVGTIELGKLPKWLISKRSTRKTFRHFSKLRFLGKGVGKREKKKKKRTEMARMVFRKRSLDK